MGIINIILSAKDIIPLAIGAALSWVLTRYYYSKNISKPHYKTRSDYISSDEFKETGIRIKHNEENIENLSITRVAIWNNGNTIRNSDVANMDPVGIKITNGVVLDYKIVYAKEENNIQIEKNNDRLNTRFDFLAKRQGYVLRVYHTGIGSNNIMMCGSFVDGKKLASNGIFSYRKMIPHYNSRILSFKRKTRSVIFSPLFFCNLYFCY